jgi:hypothetical protein
VLVNLTGDGDMPIDEDDPNEVAASVRELTRVGPTT